MLFSDNGEGLYYETSNHSVQVFVNTLKHEFLQLEVTFFPDSAYLLMTQFIYVFSPMTYFQGKSALGS